MGDVRELYALGKAGPATPKMIDLLENEARKIEPQKDELALPATHSAPTIW